MFDCGNGDPTFNYDLDQAVPTYLKTYKNIDVSTKFIREGITYKELSDKDKSKYHAHLLIHYNHKENLNNQLKAQISDNITKQSHLIKANG
mgnify:CR=1 FL=1